jgi:hypothetical protein
MRSKWLDWTPETGSVGFDRPPSANFPITRASEGNGTLGPSRFSDPIIEKLIAKGPTKPTEPMSATDGEALEEIPSCCWGRYGDAHGWRAHVALEAICGIRAPEGLVVWLGEASPLLYRRLTDELPNKISRAWRDRVPFAEFDSLCFEWVGTFRRAVEMRLAGK